MLKPSERIINDSAASSQIRDSSGRLLLVRRPDALDRLRLFKTLGSELSLNTPYLGMALLASCVSAIDDIPVPPPVTEDQIETLVRRLGDIGIEAIANALEPQQQLGGGAPDPGN